MSGNEQHVPEGVPRAVIEIGGETYTLVYTLGTALRLRRELRRIGIDADNADAMQGADEAEVALLTLWAMAAHGPNRGLSPDEFADRIPIDQLEDVMETIAEVKTESHPDLDPEEQEPEEPEGEASARRTTGAGAA